jgi:hypothetical protein
MVMDALRQHDDENHYSVYVLNHYLVHLEYMSIILNFICEFQKKKETRKFYKSNMLDSSTEEKL